MCALSRCRAMGLILCLGVGSGCEESKPAGAAASATVAASVSAPKAEAPAPVATFEPCKASGETPTELGQINGELYGLGADATRIYYSSWQLYGSRGDVVAVRKDGGGQTALVSLKFEPRSLAVDDKYIFYTAGILLQRTPKDGSTTDTINEQFSAKSISLLEGDVYGVPGDYGPYDRVARISKRGGEIKELVNSTRPKVAEGPVGFVSVVADKDGIVMADAGGKRVLSLPLGGGKLKTLAKSKEAPLAVLATGSSVYFAAQKGGLMRVDRKGGASKKLAGPLTDTPQVAGDDAALYTVLAGDSPDAATTVVRVSASGGEPKKLATVPAGESVTGLLADDRCVYFISRQTAAKSRIYALPR